MDKQESTDKVSGQASNAGEGRACPTGYATKERAMKRETGTAIYFWVMLIAGVLLGLVGKSVEGTVMTAAAGIVAVLNLIARDYFDGA